MCQYAHLKDIIPTVFGKKAAATALISAGNNGVSGALIHLDSVSKSFKVGAAMVPVLNQISLQVQRGEFVAVVGPSGNGKSTLLNMVTGIDAPSSGTVHVGGHCLNGMSENDLAAWRGATVGIIFQFFQMLPALTLLQNVVLPMDFSAVLPARQRRERAAHLLALVGLADQAHKLPNMVSGGQQQRAAIARALANDPPLLLADEPTGNLDSKTAAEIFELFCALVEQGKTMVMVTHDKELARRIPRVVEIVNGQVSGDWAQPVERYAAPPALQPALLSVSAH